MQRPATPAPPQPRPVVAPRARQPRAPCSKGGPSARSTAATSPRRVQHRPAQQAPHRAAPAPQRSTAAPQRANRRPAACNRRPPRATAAPQRATAAPQGATAARAASSPPRSNVLAAPQQQPHRPAHLTAPRSNLACPASHRGEASALSTAAATSPPPQRATAAPQRATAAPQHATAPPQRSNFATPLDPQQPRRAMAEFKKTRRVAARGGGRPQALARPGHRAGLLNIKGVRLAPSASPA